MNVENGMMWLIITQFPHQIARAHLAVAVASRNIASARSKPAAWFPAGASVLAGRLSVSGSLKY